MHYSSFDPEARISVKPGKAQALNYLCSMAVNEGHGLISHIQADFADRRDGACPVSESVAGVVWAATLPDEGPTGQFFRDGQPLPW